MKKFIWILVFIIIAGGIALAIYANRNKDKDTTAGTQELGSILGQNTETNDGTYTAPSTSTSGSTPSNSTSNSTSSSTNTTTTTTPKTTDTRSSGSPAVVTPTTKTYLIPAIGLQVTVPLSWYEFSSAGAGSIIGFYNQAGTTQYGSVEVFQSGAATNQTLQNDLLNDPTVSDVRPTTYNGVTAYSFVQSGTSGRVTAFVHNGDVYYLRGQVLTQATLKFK